MWSYADGLGHRGRHEARVIVSWAETLCEIANGLTASLADNDPDSLRRVWTWARQTAAPFVLGAVVTGLAQGAGSAALYDPQHVIVECAARIVDNADADDQVVLSWAGDVRASASWTEADDNWRVEAMHDDPQPSAQD